VAINTYWEIVRRVNFKAYLRHMIDLSGNEFDPEADCMIEDLLYLETKEWVRRAERVHISPSHDIPLPSNGKAHWQRSYDGSTYLKDESLRKLKKLVEDAEYEKSRRKREGRELWIKWFTAIAAGLAALASIGNLYFTFRKK
jgi:hypothetical protein